MPNATPTDLPTRVTRTLIRRAVAAGEAADKAVAQFTDRGRRAVAAFNAEVNPLRLPDADYEALVERSRLRVVLDLAGDMHQDLLSLLADRH